MAVKAVHETDMVKKSQAAIEAVKLLREAGFTVYNFEVDPAPESPLFNLEADLSIRKNERPLEALD